MQKKDLMDKMMIRLLIITFLLISCAAVEEPHKERWIVASQYLPKEQLKGLIGAGFFEIGDEIYSHHCDSHGNMIRYKYDEKNKTWHNIKYETLGCVSNQM